MKKIFTLFAALTMVLSMFAATETVYFVNASSWTGTINAYAWTDGGANNQGWPGVAAAKEAEQIAGYDVYSYTAETGAYAKVIFNNGSSQTANLDWTAGKYFVVDGWYTKEEAEDKLATPIPDTWTVAGGPESVFGSNWNTTDANNDMVKQANGTYKWEKTGLELVANSTISFKVVKNHAWDEAYPGSNYDLSIPENGIYTITITFDPSTKSVNAVATKTSDAEVEVTISYVLMGVAGDWTTGIALTANPDNANEYVLLGQTIAEGDAVKVVTLTNGEKTAYCGNVDEYSVEHSADKDGNIVLAPGTYDFYYKVAENLIYIGAVAPELPTYDVTTTATVSTQGQNIVLSGSWEEKALTVMLWQGGATQGFGTYAAEDYAPIFLGTAELTPTTAGVYADNGDGTFTFTATATDAEGAIYNITLTGANPAAVEPETVEIEATVPFNVENGELYIDACEENYAWCLNFTISGYDGYGNYEVAGLYSTDNDYSVFGTLNVSYNEFQETDMIMGTLKTADESLVVLVTLYKEAAGEGQPTVLNVTDLVVNPETAAFEGTCITEQGMMLTLSLVPDLQKPVADKPMTYELNLEKSSIQIAAGLRPTPLTLTSGEIATDYATPAAVATVAASLDAETFLFTINMTAAAAEAIEIELEATSAVVDEDVLTLYATYEDEEGDTYPVAVELQGFENVVGDKEYKAEEICKITIGNSEVEEELMDVAYANSVMVIIGENGEISLEGEFSSWESGSDYYVTITGSLNGKQEPEYEVFEDVINNLVVTDEMAFIGGPSTQYGLEVFLVLGQDNLDGTFALDLEQSAIALDNNDLTIVSGYLKDVDMSAPAATAVIVAQLSESETYEFHLTMSGAPAETVVIVVEDALVEVEEWKDFPEAPTSNYALTMTADWTNEANGVTYPVKVEVLVYDPNVTEQADAISNVVVGENIFSEIWLGGVDGCFLNLTTVGGVITAKGVVTTSNGVALDLTISGKLPQGPGTGLDNVQVEVKTVKMIKNGQLIINKGGREFNAQGATVK